ncbi:MAG: glycoside hydrolase family 3 C-terminal domain-containing protein [Actinocatenispora sp.]
MTISDTNVDKLVAQLTLEEKASLASGSDYWSTKAVDRLGIASLELADGSHGLRKQRASADHPGMTGTHPATCFPPAVALASTWDVDLLGRVGAALGREARARDVAVLLGPGVNIKRSPLCGRNFEYFSEDPHVAGQLGAALVRGVQSEGVGTVVKHFAANNQETDRMVVSSDVDERTLREIYLNAFETVVREAQPWLVMASYNKINGVWSCENPWLLRSVLRGEWGFTGAVVSDWLAVNSRVAGLAAGLDLEMPGAAGNDERIVAAVRDGSLDEAVLDDAVLRVLRLVEAHEEAGRAHPAIEPGTHDDAHHELARAAAADSIVLLKNDGDILPLTGSDLTIGVVGEFARTPRFQGAGSSQVNPTRVDNALDAVTAAAQRTGSRVAFAPGYRLDGADPTAAPVTDPATDLVAEAVEVARTADVALVFVGLPDGAESESYDRQHIDLPAEQDALVRAVAAVNPRTVVVLSNGSVVSLEAWHDAVPAVVEAWLLGQAGGGAVADVLFGAVNPSGRLAETIPLRLSDTPAYLNYPGEGGHVRYGEGVFVGYRHYQSTGREVRYPFGHGLSYTTFDWSELATEVAADGAVSVSVLVTNTGTTAGKDVVQVYVAPPSRPVRSPARELRAFAKVDLAPGESRRVRLTLERRAFAYYHVGAGQWVVAAGDHEVQVARSAADVVLSATVGVTGDAAPADLTIDSTVREWLEHPVAGPALMQGFAATGETGDGSDQSTMAMIAPMPLRRVSRLPGVPVTEEQLEGMVAQLRQAMGLTP